jgi:hypothetical protein
MGRLSGPSTGALANWSRRWEDRCSSTRPECSRSAEVPVTTKGGVVQELDAQATVVDAGGISSGLTTTIARSDVQTALAESEIPPLVLDIQRGDESSSVALTWKRDDLERLLGEATGDQIQLTFDSAAIEQAFGDVEAHGLREKAAIVAVAVAGAAAFAGGASAMPMGTGGGGPAAPVAVSGPSGVHLGDTTAVAASVDDPAIATAMRDAQSPAAAPVDDPAIASAIASYAEAPPAAHIGDTTAGTQTGLNTETGPSGAHLGDTTAGAGPQVAYSTDDGTSWSDVGSGAAAVGAGAAILIVGAAFALGSRRQTPLAT